MSRILAIVVLAALAVPGQAINVVIDYTYAGSFFNPSTTNGALARANVEFAADYFSTIIDDTLTPITTPDDFVSAAGGIASWSWNTSFPNPSGSGSINLVDVPIAEDEYRIYVGAEPIAGSTLGFGGFSTAGWGLSIGGTESFFPNDIPQIDQITDDFDENLELRGKSTGEWANWGAYLSLDSSENWHYDHTTVPPSNRNDLFSTVLHEIGHALGFGTAPQWQSKVSGNTFFGLNSFAANGDAYPALSDPGHWAENTQSPVFGGTDLQEAAMDPNITTGTRKFWTELDSAGLADIGWNVVAPPSQAGDYNNDGLVNAVDYATWRDNLGTPNAVGTYTEWSANYGASASSLSVPEPATLALIAGSLIMGGLVRRNSRR